MMPIPFSSIRWSKILPIAIILVPFIFFFVGIPNGDIASDAHSYAGYATSIVTGHGYTYLTPTFSNIREPLYPLFIAGTFIAFGLGKYVGLYVLQTLLLGLLGYIVFKAFDYAHARTAGYIAGFLTALLPVYGLYTHTVGTELPFAFLVGLAFYLIYRIAIDEDECSMPLFALTGFVFGCATLVRVQIIFLLPVLVVLYFWKYRNKVSAISIKIIVACLLFVAPIAVWMGYVHSQNGTWTIVSSRPALSLFIRAERAKMSYHDLTRYAYLWLKRSLTGGQYDQFLFDHDYQKLGDIDYAALATSTQAVARIKAESQSIIAHNIGHFLYGNVIEAVKTVYIEHDYTNVINRYLRAAMYLVVYGICLIGLVCLWLTRRIHGYYRLHMAALLSFLMIFYNVFVISWFDAIPRYNTPFLTLYIVIGIAGIAKYISEKRKYKQKQLGF